jgi:hypothetical protein
MKRVVTKEGSKQVGGFLWIGLQSIIVSPFMSQDAYNKKLSSQLSKMNSVTIGLSIAQIVEFIKITKQFSVEFKDTDEETEVIVKVLPSLRPFYRDVYNHVKVVRKKYGLK